MKTSKAEASKANESSAPVAEAAPSTSSDVHVPPMDPDEVGPEGPVKGTKYRTMIVLPQFMKDKVDQAASDLNCTISALVSIALTRELLENEHLRMFRRLRSGGAAVPAALVKEHDELTKRLLQVQAAILEGSS